MKKIVLLLAVFISMKAFAQDPHFTQYFTSPLTLNPANTGLVNCDWRLSGNYKSQWGSINNFGYTTGTVSYDMAILKNKLKGDQMGVGVLALYDRSGSGGLQNITTGLSLAYHKHLSDDEYKPQTISLGVQGYLVQKTVNQEKLIFGNQYNPITGTTTEASGENIQNSDPYPDFNVGLMYTGVLNEKTTLYGGVSYYHLTRPNEIFSNSTVENKINSRITVSGGGSFQMNEGLVLFLSTMYQQQGKASEFLVGGAAGFVLNPEHEDEIRSSIFYLGAWYRYNDAIAPYIGFEFQKVKFGLTYDVNLSSLTPATKSQGGLEISAIYNGCIIKNETRKYNFACPRF
ncbi:MAG: PorP/SprF family type IX secretion system membrane protein [Chitinophagaceae bacterium]|nr:PorP/SprF family type IX secretion system membrane protein [Chitinophagaceae bacterium]